MQLENGVLYILESESAGEANIDIRDSLTGVSLKVHLPAQHAALALIDKKTKQIVAKYGF
jgi:hypothetical protein